MQINPTKPTINNTKSQPENPTLYLFALSHSQPLRGINRAIAKRCCKQFAPENLTLYLFTLFHPTITRD